MASTADVVVVGAGIVGAGIALELAKAGLRVVVIDRRHQPGAGSTADSSAIVRMNYSTWEGVALAWEACQAWGMWGDVVGLPQSTVLAKYVETGVLVLQAPGLAFDTIQQHLVDAGVDCEWLDAASAANRFPYFDLMKHYPPKRLDDPRFWDDAAQPIGGLLTKQGGFVHDPSLAAQNQAEAASRAGVEFLFNRGVVRVDQKNNRVAGVELDSGESISTPVLVNAAGPWSESMNDLLPGAMDRAVGRNRVLRQEVHYLPAPAGYRYENGAPVVMDADLGIYFRPDLVGGVLVGGVEPECDPLEWVEADSDYGRKPRNAIWEVQTMRLARRLPDLRVPNRPAGSVGIYDVSPDWIPTFDRTDIEGYYVAVGTSGNQFKNAPVIGQLMSALISAVEGGYDHDAQPMEWTGPITGLRLNLGHYSRLRTANEASSYSVMG